MFQKLVNHNPDLQRLVDKRYAITVDEANYLVVRDIPYLDSALDLKWGSIVSKVIFVDEVRIRPEDHQIFFAGSVPYQLDGTPISNLGGGPTTLTLGEDSSDVMVERSFSNKPKSAGQFIDFVDFFAKIESYIGIISGPAMEKYGVHPYTARRMPNRNDASVFKFRDTLTSRAEITDLAALFKNDVIAIIGLGGTGAYLLDYFVKTPVREIRGYDADEYLVHNAFRSPGQVDPQEFGKPKADVFGQRYKNFRHGLYIKAQYIDANSGSELEGVTFAFVCVDKGSSRKEIFNLLIQKGIPFIDVGMGLKRKDQSLNGMLRATFVSEGDPHIVREAGLVEMSDPPDNIYKSNIQIAELNALNACLAIIKFKQLRGFYSQETPYFHILMGLGNTKIFGEEG